MKVFHTCYFIFILITMIIIYRNHGKKFKLFKYNSKYIYFKEIPMGMSGVVYNGILYVYDSESLTECGGIYDPVFEIKDGRFISKCFISENIVKDMFEKALEKSYGDISHNVDFNFPIIVNH